MTPYIPQRTGAKPGFVIILISLVGIFLLSGSAFANPFTSPDGSFSVNFPSPPTEKNADKKTFVGTIRETYFSDTSPKGYFLVGYTHLPGIMIFFGGHHKILERAKNILLDKEGGQPVSFVDTNVDGRNAKKLVFKKSNGDLGKALFIFEKHRVYLALATSPQGATIIDPFLMSFRLALKQKDKPAINN